MQLKDPRGDSCLNEKLEYDKSKIEEKMGEAKVVAGQYYREGNFKLFSEYKIKECDLNAYTLFKCSYKRYQLSIKLIPIYSI